MKHCWPKKLYYVMCRWVAVKNGSRNYVRTPSLGRARYYAKKLKLKVRQIDVRQIGKKAYVLQGSWL
jgi:hypothetical protein